MDRPADGERVWNGNSINDDADRIQFSMHSNPNGQSYLRIAATFQSDVDCAAVGWISMSIAE